VFDLYNPNCITNITQTKQTISIIVELYVYLQLTYQQYTSKHNIDTHRNIIKT